ncbi:MAG: DUF4105 domain-containing protein [Prevotellaceae bacterium]|nr:DUF4105 domain-containing protein [Prevotellaceae bacterium]MDY5209882.1 DUF4105 domain-containing protein [Prevotella sp.]
MKKIKDIYKRLFVGIFMLIVSQLVYSQASDSIEVSLLTCAPGTKVYALYGHTAIRYHDLRTGEDLTFNYGVFNFNRPFFSLRFLFGLTDYELGVCPYKYFAEEYRQRGSQVTEQVINMTSQEKAAIYHALAVNYKDENKVYRYNCFYDNCTTRARDMIEHNLDGKVKYINSEQEQSYRELLHQYTDKYPWAKFGVDLCLGFMADRRIGSREQQFLPDYMMIDAEKAQIMSDGSFRPLVKESRNAVVPGVQIVEQPFPLTPVECALILLFLSLAIMGLELHRKKVFRIWDTLIMLITGLAGLFILALIFSQHPTTSSNLQFLLLNPLPLFFIIRLWRKPQNRLYWKISTGLIVLFFIGGALQDYAEGMNLVALSLLTRCVTHFKL